MPIAPYRHKEYRADGKPVFIIRTPLRNFNGMRLKVPFFNGEGRTVYESRARMFAEVFGYEVILPEGHPGLELAEAPAVPRGEDEGLEAGPDYLLEEPEDEEEVVVPARRGRRPGRPAGLGGVGQDHERVGEPAE